MPARARMQRPSKRVTRVARRLAGKLEDAESLGEAYTREI